ncbi:hypothetical protein [Nocardia sp. NPDC052112]
MDEYDDTAVSVGCIDFLTIRLGGEHISADILCVSAIESAA